MLSPSRSLRRMGRVFEAAFSAPGMVDPTLVGACSVEGE
jgi:hypothetical protein